MQACKVMRYIWMLSLLLSFYGFTMNSHYADKRLDTRYDNEAMFDYFFGGGAPYDDAHAVSNDCMQVEPDNTPYTHHSLTYAESATSESEDEFIESMLRELAGNADYQSKKTFCDTHKGASAASYNQNMGLPTIKQASSTSSSLNTLLDGG